MKTYRLVFCIFCLSLFFLQEGHSQDMKLKSFQLKGYVKYLQTVYFAEHKKDPITNNLIHNRLNLKWNFSKHFLLRIEMRNRLFYGEQVKLIPDFGRYILEDNENSELSWLLINEKSFVFTTSFDRVLVNYMSEKISLTIGKQRINWGINTVWNPIDLFNAYNFLDFDYQERPGCNAIRIQYFPGTLASLELALKPSFDNNYHVAALLYKFNKWKYDFQFLGGVYKTDIAAGAGWAGNIKNAGFKGELVYFRSKNDLKNGNDDFTASVSADYSFKNNWYVSASALYVQNPVPVLYGQSISFQTKLSARNLMPFRYSFYASIMKSFSPILNGNLAVIYSPKDNSTIIFPGITYNLGQNFDLDFTAQSFLTDQSGEFKNKDISLFIRMTWSF